ncbi:toll/interleukin-1 receptor domain-containing protein [Marinisporobacter balticus]|uniref:TIR domain-containing protein n=1 Tax=Marinisporobacter balticus TaxID=2018667 RepID=A0A4V2SCF0_9FIRM|nr:toll/interleukin-1 receptor domain-containing protein [Marinisporobacter balticus]TCO79090.1 TIR domain-containing protein [Marinisporobacter balticus]
MEKTLDRDYVWECDYGVRKPLIPVLEILLEEQDATSLQMINLMVNQNIYNLEFFIVLSYDQPEEGHINRMKELFLNVGVKYRPDINYDELFSEMAYKRFNTATLGTPHMLEMQFNALFDYKERDEVAKIISMRPLGKKVPVFLSHTSRNKPEIEDLIPYLNAANLPIWYDDINIDYGESIVTKVQEGIKESGAVIFWITKEFIKSNWCQIEMDGFLTRLAGRNDILVLAVVHEDVDKNDLPVFLSTRKYLAVSKPDSLEAAAKKLIPTLKKYFKSKGLL